LSAYANEVIYLVLEEEEAMKRKLNVLIAVLVLAGMTLSACTPVTATTTASSPATPQPQQPALTEASGGTSIPTSSPSNQQVKNPDTLIEATINGPESLDPAWEYDTASYDADIQVYEGLVLAKKD
jgi:ABC-type transport system substrate-binding protein